MESVGVEHCLSSCQETGNDNKKRHVVLTMCLEPIADIRFLTNTRRLPLNIHLTRNSAKTLMSFSYHLDGDGKSQPSAREAIWIFSYDNRYCTWNNNVTLI